jgi:hypothetical protein
MTEIFEYFFHTTACFLNRSDLLLALFYQPLAPPFGLWTVKFVAVSLGIARVA